MHPYVLRANHGAALRACIHRQGEFWSVDHNVPGGKRGAGRSKGKVAKTYSTRAKKPARKEPERGGGNKKHTQAAAALAALYCDEKLALEAGRQRIAAVDVGDDVEVGCRGPLGLAVAAISGVQGVTGIHIARSVRGLYCNRLTGLVLIVRRMQRIVGGLRGACEQYGCAQSGQKCFLKHDVFPIKKLIKQNN